MNEPLSVAVRGAVLIAALMTAMPYLTWFERRVIARLRGRRA